MEVRPITVDDKTIGNGFPVFIVAEISGNHNQDIDRALKIIDAAAEAGADAIKLQTYTADTITLDSDRPEFIVEWQGKKVKLFDLYEQAHTPWEWHEKLFAHAKMRGLICFSSPFDSTAVDFLEKLETPLYKVASPEVVDVPLLEAIGKTQKPVVLSRGMSTFEELELAIKTLREFGTKDIAILQCVSAYPANPRDMHLKNIPHIMERFGVMTGLSDHTLGNECATASVALGACIIEKHLTLHRADGGPDANFSLEPEEFAALVTSIRIVEQALGEPSDSLQTGERKEGRKSLWSACAIAKGEVFTEKNVRSVRPGNGLAPKYYRHVLGKRATRDIPFATPLSHDLISE